MNRTNSIKKQLEYMVNEEENQFCFDCGKKPAHWASVNNAVYLCLDCSGDHRGLGVSISYIRSVTLDTWNENQVVLLMAGGNKRLREFLKSCDIPRTFPRKQLYSSKIFNYYRKMLKAEANNELFSQEIPDKRTMLDPYTADSEVNLNKMMINISSNHYTNSYNSVSSSVSNEGEKYSTISKSYKDDNRFASVSSQPLNDDEPEEVPDTTSGKIFFFLGAAYGKTKELACIVKDKVSTMELGSKIIYGGGVAVEAVKYTGSVVYEKGQEFAHSGTFQTIKDKTSEGLGYIVGKITQKGSSIENGQSNSNNKYSSCSSSNHNNNENDDSGTYQKMDDNKKENLLDDDYRKY